MNIRNILSTLLVATSLLIIPIIASFVVNGWAWTLFDYVFAWVLFAGIGMIYTFVASKGNNTTYKIATALGAIGVLALIWINGAVGIIGSENNPANMMYEAVLIVGLWGMIISGLKPKGMTITMSIVAISQILVPIAALLLWNTDTGIAGESFWGNRGIAGVFMINAAFAVLWIATGLLFHKATQTHTTK